jgi:hypothetical protein
MDLSGYFENVAFTGPNLAYKLLYKNSKKLTRLSKFLLALACGLVARREDCDALWVIFVKFLGKNLVIWESLLVV